MFSLCIFESGTVKSDCPVQIFRKMVKYLKIEVSLTKFTVFLEILKKNSSTLNLKKKSRNQPIKSSGLIHMNWDISDCGLS